MGRKRKSMKIALQNWMIIKMAKLKEIWDEYGWKRIRIGINGEDWEGKGGNEGKSEEVKKTGWREEHEWYENGIQNWMIIKTTKLKEIGVNKIEKNQDRNKRM